MYRCLTTSILSVIVFLTCACDDNVWDDLPAPVRNFIIDYFPFGEVASSVVDNGGVTTVQIKNGATLKFARDYSWLSIDGNGMPLPAMFIYDRMPPVLYRYLEEMEQVDSVFAVSRNATSIEVSLLDTNLTYHIATARITYPVRASSKIAASISTAGS